LFQTSVTPWRASRSGNDSPAKKEYSRSRNVVLEFKDYETALACYNSPEYARLVAIRAPFLVVVIAACATAAGVHAL